MATRPDEDGEKRGWAIPAGSGELSGMQVQERASGPEVVLVGVVEGSGESLQ